MKRHCITCLNAPAAAFMRFRQGLPGSEGWTLSPEQKSQPSWLHRSLYPMSGGTSWVTGVGPEVLYYFFLSNLDFYAKIIALAMLVCPFFFHLSYCKVLEVEEG